MIAVVTGASSGIGEAAARRLARDANVRRTMGHGVHVGLVLPGFIATEGFPGEGASRERAHALAGLRRRHGC